MPTAHKGTNTLNDRTHHHLLATVGTAPERAQPAQIMHALALSAREHLSQRWVANDSADRAARARRVNYLSMEFLMGRTLGNALAALGLQGDAADAVRAHSATLEDVAATEPDAALGNGGLGRLAACFLDSMATLGLPSFGYGIRYEFGMFAQSIEGGRQVERPDPWLEEGTPWEFPRPDVNYRVRFGGSVVAAAQTGLGSLLSLIAFLSINLAVLNLLPIPILDGGQVLITVAEGAMGKPFGERARENMMRVGLAFILALFVLVMFNDLKALGHSIFG